MPDQDISKQLEKLRNAFRKELRESVNDIRLDALYQQLLMQHVFKQPEPLAAMTTWSIAPEFAWWLYQYVTTARPEKIIELGSGTSTLVIAAALKQLGKGNFLSFEHDHAYYEKIRVLLQACDLQNHVELLYAPLEKLELAGDSYRWYDLPYDLIDHMIGRESLDLLLIDGPPAATNRHARYPAMLRLRDYCNDSTAVLLDDAGREEEQEILARWIELSGGKGTYQLLSNIRHGPALFYPSKQTVSLNICEDISMESVSELVGQEVEQLVERALSELPQDKNGELAKPLLDAFYRLRERSLHELKIKYSAVNEQCQALEKQVLSLQTELADAVSVGKQRLAERTAIQDQLDKLTADRQQMSAQIEALEANLTGARDAQTALEQGTAERQDQIATLETQRDELLGVIEGLKGELGDAFFRIERAEHALEQGGGEWQGSIAALQVELDEQFGVIEALKVELADMQGRIERADTRENLTLEELQKLQEKLGASAVELDEAQSREFDLESRLQRVEAREVALLEELEMSDNQTRLLRKELEELTECCASLHAQIELSKLEVVGNSKLKKALEDSEIQVGKLKAELKSARLKRNEYRQALIEYSAKYSDALLVSECAELQREVLELKDFYYHSSLNYQVARAISHQIKSPLGVLKLPLAIWRILLRYRSARPKRAKVLGRIKSGVERLKDLSIVQLPLCPGGGEVKSLLKFGGGDEVAFLPVSDVVLDICKIARKRAGSHALFKTVLRTGSLQGRDLLASLASNGRLSASQLIGLAESYRNPALKHNSSKSLDSLSLDWVMQFSRVLAGQCYEADDELNAFTLMFAMFEVHGASRIAKDGALETLGALAVNLGKKKELDIILSHVKEDSLYGKFLRIDAFHPSLGGGASMWLEKINHFLQSYGVESIDLGREGDRVFSRIDCRAAVEKISGPLVSVIVTAWRPDECLLQAVSSILNQSWQNLEVIVVDDASPAEFTPVFEACMSLDSRVSVIRQAVNQGTYLARNAALKVAKGEYVTFQDSDDWSHPRRVELQVRPLESDRKLVSSYSYCLRVSEDLVFTKPDRPVYRKNTSSLLFRRAPVLESIGYMDAARKGADSEYGVRMKLIFGEESSCEVKIPLAFVRLGDDSLSRQEFKSGWHHPSRMAYKNSYSHWHGLIRLGKESAYNDGTVGGRRFPVPLRFQVDRECVEDIVYDVVFVGDWRSYGGPQKSMIEEIRALHKRGMKVGVCALEAYRFMIHRMQDLCLPVSELIYNRIVDNVVPDDRITARLVILRYPPILQWVPHGSFAWVINNAWVVANQAPHERDGRDVRYNVSDCIRNARLLFGVDPLWVPQGPQVREILEPLLPAKLLAPYDDPGILDMSDWRVERGGWSSNIPVVGRYSRDNLMKFPSSAQLMSSAYMAGREVKVRIMGGQKSLSSMYDGAVIPKNWEVLPYGAMPVLDFLSEIDFFVYFDNENIVEAFGRSILEAVASGVVAVLSPSFQPVFAEAAIYCKEEDVFGVISRFYANRELYEDQVRLATRCVNEFFSHDAFFQRVSSVLEGRV